MEAVEKGSCTHVQPNIMVIEDCIDDLESRVERFNHFGCVAFGAKHTDEAIKLINNLPAIDLVFSDIDMDLSGTDLSGVYLFDLMQKLRPDIPFYLYSAHIGENNPEIVKRSALAGRVFDKSLVGEKANEIYNKMYQEALQHRLKKKELVESKLRELAQSDSTRVNGSLEKIRDLAIQIDGASSIDSQLSGTSYSLSIVELKLDESEYRQFLVWHRKNDDFFEYEVYGFPELYSVAESEELAISQLNDLIVLVKNEILGEQAEEELSPSVIRLIKFLSE